MMSEKMLHMTHLALIVTAIWCRSVLSTEYMNMSETKPLPDTNAVPYKITVLTTASSSSCDKEFLSVTIDSDALQGNWDGFNLSLNKLQNIAQALAPCDLRLGGIMADFIIFSPNAPTPSEIKEQTDQNITMSGTQWDELTTFVKKVGWNFIFDFNVFLRSQGVWDPSNANLLLNYSAARGVHISGFQLGNEPAHYQRLFNVTITPSDLVTDFKILRYLISSHAIYKGSHLYGPDTTSGSLYSSSMKYLRQFIEAGGADVVDEIGIHQYYMRGYTAVLHDFLNSSTLDSLKTILDAAFNITSLARNPVRIRLSETSSCFGGGAPNMSNAYVAGFLWLDKLGIAAQYGLSRVFRQSFFGASYGLVDLRGIAPNPDYYLSVLFKRLVEGPVFPITSTPGLGQLRLYANCARIDFFSFPPGALVLYYLNLGTEKAILSLTQFPNEDREVFILTPGDERGLNSRFVKLNGQILLMNGTQVPQMMPSHQRGDITAEAQSFGFIVIPQANVPACVSFHGPGRNGVKLWQAKVQILYFLLFILLTIYYY